MGPYMSLYVLIYPYMSLYTLIRPYKDSLPVRYKAFFLNLGGASAPREISKGKARRPKEAQNRGNVGLM